MSDRTLEHSVISEIDTIIREMIKTVQVHYGIFPDEGMPLKALSAKYGNRFKRLGTAANFQETRHQLAKDGTLQITMHRVTGSQRVFPGYVEDHKGKIAFVELDAYLEANPDERLIRP